MFNFLNTRTNRATYWVSIALVVGLLGLASWAFRTPQHLNEAVWVFVCVPRLHDIGRTGWIMLGLVPLEIAAVAVAMTNPSLGAEPFGVVVLLMAAFTIWLGAVPGQAGANRFGERPAPGIDLKPRSKPVGE